MAWPPTNSPRRGILGADPARTIRCSVAMLLRLGIGLSLLSTGLAGYFGASRPGGGIGLWGQSLPLHSLDPFLAMIPYLSIGLGLALILGFMTTISAIAAGFFSLAGPILGIILMIAHGPVNGLTGMSGYNPLLDMIVMASVQNSLNYAALIWLSPLENHPYSVDALIFGKNNVEPTPPTPVEPGGPSADPESTVHIHG